MFETQSHCRSRWKMSWIAGAALAALGFPAGAAQMETMPGDGTNVKMARATWDTGWFQAEVYMQALRDLGYTVEGSVTLDNPPFYQSVSQGDVDLWVNGWFPLHNTYAETFESGATKIGYVAKGGALQGYLVDKKTAEKLNINSLEDFKRTEVKEAFDTNGNGKAEMVACPPGGGCETVISHHLDAYKLRDHVEPIKAGYSASMADALGRYKNGEPIFFYTWTPNWTVGLLKPGEDVVWISVDAATLQAEQKELEDATELSDVTGCIDDPCQMGWPANDIRPVANKAFLEENPAAKKLLEVVSIPIQDIFAQNAKMNAGEDSTEDLQRHAMEWIEKNRATYDGWLEQARSAAQSG